MEAKKLKVIPLGNHTNVLDVLTNLILLTKRSELEGLVIIATEEGGDINRWFFDKSRRCVEILGLIEYMKAYVIDEMKKGQGEL